MRIIRPSRATSQQIERSAKSTATPKRRIIGDFIDEDFLRAPVDLRRIAMSELPQTSVQIDESSLTVPLFPLLGSRAPQTAGNREISAVQDILEQMTTQKENPPEFHLSEHLLPPVHYRFCPEQAYVEQRIHDVTRDRTMEKIVGAPYLRQFPLHLFDVSRAAKNLQQRGGRKKRQREGRTFSEGDPLSGLKIL
jgi:hypothetical protein